MANSDKKLQGRRKRFARRKRRTKENITSLDNRPRLSVFRSLKAVSVQVIDDVNHVTLVAASEKELPADKKKGTKTERAHAVGQLIAKKALEKKISKVVFDRSGYLYHGRVKAIADGARDAGLEF